MPVLVFACVSRLGLRWVVAALFGIPVYVGFSPPYEGEHYPSDVIAGALLGGLWLIWLLRTLSLSALRHAPGAEQGGEERLPLRQGY